MSQQVGIDRERAAAFVEAYRHAWETWDFSGFADLFSDDVVYVAHATEETVVGRAALADYIRKEAADQGEASVRMGTPMIDGDHVAAEFWVTRTNDGEKWTTAGCLIARLGRDGRCTHFREYWFDIEGHTSPYEGWGEQAMSQENVKVVKRAAVLLTELHRDREVVEPQLQELSGAEVAQIVPANVGKASCLALGSNARGDFVWVRRARKADGSTGQPKNGKERRVPFLPPARVLDDVGACIRVNSEAPSNPYSQGHKDELSDIVPAGS